MQKSKNSLKLLRLNELINDFKNQVVKKNIQLPKFVKIVELGPRDGLQNEKRILETDVKIEFINRLNECGYQAIECTSFVSPKWVPQMADNSEVFNRIIKNPNVSYPVLVPNLKGLQSALQCGVKEIAIFGAASETFTKKNINCSIDESIEKFREVVEVAQKENLKIRGYVSTVMGCPYEGQINPSKVAEVVEKLFNLGCYEVSLGDTIGMGTPEMTEQLFQNLKQFDINKLAAHFHDTHDTAISNILVALSHGISTIDSSVGGLGGCPYAQTSAGNVCTENVLYTLKQLSIKTDIDYQKVSQVGQWITGQLNRDNMNYNL